MEDELGGTTLVDVLASSKGDDLKLKFSSPEISNYLSHITSLGLPDVIQEPTNLSSEAAQLTNSLTSLCHSEYATFLSLHHTSSILSTTLNSFSESLGSLLDSIPDLENQARKFTTESKEIQRERRKASLLLEHHEKLVDLLDIPQLIDTCVRNGYYQEAMDLSAHAASLKKRFADVPVIDDIEVEVDQAMRLMLAQLLTLLREPVKLPALSKAVNFLRKMAVLEELELALAFLTSRLVNLNGLIDGIEKDHTDYARYVSRYVEVWREGVYDVATQYTTIFLARLPSVELVGELRQILSAFTHHTLAALLAVLSSNLPRIDDFASLASLLTKLTYCCTSFARVGLDFRSLLPPLFEAAVQSNMSRAFEAAASAFATTLTDAQRYHRLPSQWLIAAAVASSPPDDMTLPQSPHVAPGVLTSYPPLAIYTNAILTALNSLRLLAPASLLTPLIDLLDISLSKVVSSFLETVQSSVADSKVRAGKLDDQQEKLDERVIVQATGKVLSKLMVPFVRRALFRGVYGVKDDVPFSEELVQIFGQLEDGILSLDRRSE